MFVEEGSKHLKGRIWESIILHDESGCPLYVEKKLNVESGLFMNLIIDPLEKQESNQQFVREYIEGTTLQEYLSHRDEKEGVNEEDLIIAYGLCKSLSILHGKGIFHCNLKPSNVILHKNKFPVLCDAILVSFNETR